MFMRIRSCLFVLAAVSGAVGLTSLGCSSSSSPSSSSPSDAATNDGTTAEASTHEEASASGEDASAPMEAGPPCVSTTGGINVATFDSGSAAWGCYQNVCSGQLGACGADCVCNNAILTALLCSQQSGNPTNCFLMAYSTIVTVEAGPPASNCITNMMMTCQNAGQSDAAANDGGTTDGSPSDGGTAPADGAATDGSAADAGVADAAGGG